MATNFCKMMLTINLLLLMVLSGCEQPATKKIEITTNNQGLPEAKELLRKSSEQINSLESYGINIEAVYRNYGKTKDVVVWEGPFSTTAIQYVKSPFLLFSETNYKQNNSTNNYYVADSYGVLRNTGNIWEDISHGDQEFLDTQKGQWQLQIGPYAELKDLNDLIVTIEQENDNYILNATGSTHEQSSHEGYYDMNGKEYTLVITTDQKYKLRYVILKNTLLPQQKIQEIEQIMDYSGKKSYIDKTITFTYEDFNDINIKKLSNEVKKISKSVKEN